MTLAAKLCEHKTFVFNSFKRKETLLTAIMSTNMSHQYNTPWFLSTTRLQYDVGFGGGRNSGIVAYKSGLL